MKTGIFFGGVFFEKLRVTFSSSSSVRLVPTSRCGVDVPIIGGGRVPPMMKRRRRKCLNCGQLFRPDPRSVRHQRYCSTPACRKASKAASQARWLSKAQNRNYFRGPEHLARVRAWRAAHPGYARRGRGALQEDSSVQLVDQAEKNRRLDDGGVTRGLLCAIPCSHRPYRLFDGHRVTRGHSPLGATFSTIGARHPSWRTPPW